MHRRALVAALAASLAAAGLPAQTSVVSPRVFTGIEAPGYNAHPLGTAQANSPTMRYSQVHDDLQGVPGLIRELGFRLNAGLPGTGGQTASLLTEVLLSTAATTSTTMSTTFDSNHGLDRVTVLPPTALNFPAWPFVLRGPAPWLYRVPFQTPFLFRGTGPLCWEFRITSRVSVGTFYLDAGNAPFTISSGTLGTGCRATGRTNPVSVGTILAGATLTVSATQLAANGVALAVIGFNDTSWNGVPLPLLIPGSAGAPSGPCNVWSDFWILAAFAAAANGSGQVAIPAAAASPQWLGLTAYASVLGLDGPATPTGLVASNYHVLVGGDGLALPARRLYAASNVNAPTGSLDSFAVVVEFVY